MNAAAERMVLESFLRTLKLPAVLRDYGECARQARETGDSYETYLLALVTREVEQRQSRQLQRRVKEAHFPYLKTLEKTDVEKWVGLSALKVREYAECGYIAQRENMVILGKHGTGKTHAAIVFGMEACRRGYRVLFTTAADLVNTLLEAREEKQLKRCLLRIAKYPLLIVDELGYLPFSREGAQLLFQVFSQRYEQGSLLVTTNLPFPQWTSVFEDVNLTAALLDRLTHHCHILQFDWESIRLTESLKGRNRTRPKSGNREVAATSAPAGPKKVMNQDGSPNPS
jgi:DNA replication protein DnaC